MNKELKMYNAPTPIYCWRCGEKLEREESFWGYDDVTRKKLFETKLKCPRSRFYNLHTVINFNYNGDEIISII